MALIPAAAAAVTAAASRASSPAVPPPDSVADVALVAPSAVQGSLTGHAGIVTCMALLGDGERLATGSVDYTVRLWDLPTRTCIRELTGHKAQVSCVAVRNDQTLISGSYDTKVLMWRISSGRVSHTLSLTWMATAVAAAGDRVAYAGSDGGIRIFGVGMSASRVSPSPITSLVGLANGWFVAGMSNAALRVFDPMSMVTTAPRYPSGTVRAAAWLLDGRFVTAGVDRMIRIWDSTSGTSMRVLSGHSQEVTSLALFADGRIISGSRDGKAVVWGDLQNLGNAVPQNYAVLQRLTDHVGGVTCVGVLADARAVTGSTDGMVRVWDAFTGECERTLSGHNSPISCLAVLTGSRVLACSDNNDVRVWNTVTGHTEASMLRSAITSRITCCLQLSQTRSATGHEDGNVMIWDTAEANASNTGSGEADAPGVPPVRVINAHPGGKVLSLARFLDLRFATAGADKAVRIWHLHSGELSSALHVSQPVAALASNPSQTQIMFAQQ